ncbi:hydrolase [Trichoderma guizhouense]|uniref:haloalkane dehalogenase n=1 Tax=Trichoderma guizhouense TaxID=1491466 RepID=A0A1T3D1I7_9HYPO|nr:hydrolase [Trichoderma guizhouense]
MTEVPKAISGDFPFEKKKVQILGSQMAYVDVGTSDQNSAVTVFLHGVPTSSYLWRNIIPYAAAKGRCIAPDLIGFGDSDKVPGAYFFEDHQRYIDAFLDTVLPTQAINLVIHDWGSALGFNWARRNEHRLAGIAFMEFIHPIENWSDLPPVMVENWKKFRDPDTRVGRSLLIDQNVFIEHILPSGVVRPLTDEEMNAYCKPFLQPEWREPIYRLPNELPVEGQPENTWSYAKKYMEWLFASDKPKLLFWAKPGGLVWEAKAEELAQKLKNAKVVYLGEGIHYVQEDHPHTIGRELADWLPLSSD